MSGYAVRVLSAAALLCAVFPFFAGAIEFSGLEARGGLSLVINPDEGTPTEPASAPSPVVIHTASFGAAFVLTSFLELSPALEATGIRFLLRGDRPYPADEEWADYTELLVLTLSSPVTYLVPVSDTVVLGFGLGPLFSFRIPVKAWGKAESEQLSSYWLSNGRWFAGEAVISSLWRFAPGLAFTGHGRIRLPLSNLWDDRSLIDLASFDLQIGFRFLLPSGSSQ